MERNFSYVADRWPAVAQYGRQAEDSVYTDPETCLLKLRHLTEALVGGLLGPEHPSELYAAIDELGRAHRIPHQTLDGMHRLRKLGNRAAHHEPGKDLTYGDALHALSIAHRIVATLSGQFLDPPPDVPPFREPEDRLPAIELERLLSEIEADLAKREAASAAREAALSEAIAQLRQKREQEVSRELAKRRAKLKRILESDMAIRRESRQISLFPESDPEEVLSQRLTAMEAELEAYRASCLDDIARELARIRESQEQLDAPAPAPDRAKPNPAPSKPDEPFRAAVVARGLPGALLSSTLWDRYRLWVEGGVASDRILVLLESTTRTAWTGLLKGEPPEHIAPSLRPGVKREGLAVPTGEERVFTPISWVRQELRRWWPRVEERLAELGIPSLEPVDAPIFVEVTLAQHLMERFSTDLREGDHGLLARATTPRPMQNVQMLDALARAIEHGASLTMDRAPGVSPCEALAGEIARRLSVGTDPAPAAQKLIDDLRQVLVRYLEGMLANRILDFALALDLYMAVLWSDPQYRTQLLASTSHLLFENLDEASPRMLTFVRDLCEAGLTAYVTLQEDDAEAPALEIFQGGLREYVGADPRGAREIAARMTPGAEIRPNLPFLGLARALHDAIQGSVRPMAAPPANVTLRLDHVTYPEMVEAVGQELSILLKTVPPAEIALVVPTLDPLVIWTVRRLIERLGHSLYVFAGTNRLSDYHSARLLLTLAKLAYPRWQTPPSPFELIELLEHVTGLDPLRLAKVGDQLFEGSALVTPETLRLRAPQFPEAAHGRFEHFHRWLAYGQEHPLDDFSLFFRDAFARIYVPFAGKAGTAETGTAETGTAEPDERMQREISQIGQLIEVAAEFRLVDRRCDAEGEAERGRRFMQHLAASPILERPFFKREPRRDALMLSTANQLAERGYRAPGEVMRHLFVLDLGSERWWKPDRKELTNSRVLSRRWPGGRFTLQDEQRTMKSKLARVLFACLLKPTEGLHLHGCLVDAEGRENLGELPATLEAVLNPRLPVRPAAGSHGGGAPELGGAQDSGGSQPTESARS